MTSNFNRREARPCERDKDTVQSRFEDGRPSVHIIHMYRKLKLTSAMNLILSLRADSTRICYRTFSRVVEAANVLSNDKL